MNAVEYLEQIEKFDTMIQNKQVEVEQWKDIAKGSTGQAEGERVQASGNKQKMADAVNKYTDIEAEIIAIMEKKQEIIRTIEQLPTAEYDILHKHYVQGLSVREIATKKGKEYSSISRIKKSGEKMVQNLIRKP